MGWGLFSWRTEVTFGYLRVFAICYHYFTFCVSYPRRRFDVGPRCFPEVVRFSVSGILAFVVRLDYSPTRRLSPSILSLYFAKIEAA